MVKAARRIPMTDRIAMSEQELVELIDQMRTVLPEEIRYAKHVLRQKDQILSEAQSQGDEILRTSRQQAELLIEKEGLLKQSKQQSAEIVRQARDEAERLQVGADNYVRQVLTELEESLERQIASVRKGLESLQ